MQFAHSLTRVSALALGVAGALACGQVHAAAFQLKENSVKAQGRAMAGSASAKGDASVVVNNPAMMSTFDRTTIQGDVTAIDLSFKFDGSGYAASGTPLQQPLTGGNGGEAGGVTPVPALSFILPLSDGFEYLTLGAMVSAPFGLKTEYDDGWQGRYHALKSDVEIIDLTLAASLELGDHFSAGLGAVFERSDVTLSNAIDFGSALCANPATQALCFMPNPITGPFGPQKNDGTVKVHGTDNSLGFIAGLSWRPTDNVSIGYAYRSEIDHELSGDADFTVPSNVATILAATGQYVDTGALARLTTPAVHTLSATWQATDQFALMAETSRTGWSSLQEIRIQFDNPAQADSAEAYNWGDSWFYSVGGEFAFNDAFTLRAGVARDDSPVSFPYRTPRMPDQDRMWYSIGLTWAATENFELNASYAYIDLVDTPEIDILSSSRSRLTGSYDGGANLFGVSAQYRF